MANPTQLGLDKLTVNLTNYDTIINGAAETTVELDNHTERTISYYLAQLAQLNLRGAWSGTTVYLKKDIAVESNIVYICTVDHTSGATFANDLSSGYWVIDQLDVTSAINFYSDFTVNTNDFHVDTLNNRVGIGTASPDVELHVAASSNSYQVKLERTGSTAGSVILGGRGGDFRIYANAEVTELHVLTIGTTGTVTFKEYGAGILETSGSGVISVSSSIVKSGSNIGVGEASPDTALHVSAAGNDHQLKLARTSTSTGSVILGGAGGDFRLYVDGEGAALEAIRVTATGDFAMGATAPHTVALMDLTSTTKGFLPPRMTGTQRDAITSPPSGLIVYNLTTNKLNVYTSSSWEAVTSS